MIDTKGASVLHDKLQSSVQEVQTSQLKDEKIDPLELTISKAETDRVCDKSALGISRDQEGVYDDMLVSPTRPNLSAVALDDGASEKEEGYMSSQNSAQMRRLRKRMVMSSTNVEVPEEDLQQLRLICRSLIYSKIEGWPVISQACALLEEYKQVLARNLIHENVKQEDHWGKLNSVLAYQQAKVQKCNALLMDIEHSMNSLYESKSMHLSYLAHGSQSSQTSQGSCNGLRQRTTYTHDFSHERNLEPQTKGRENKEQHRPTTRSLKCRDEIQIGTIYIAVPTLIVGIAISTLIIYHITLFLLRCLWPGRT